MKVEIAETVCRWPGQWLRERKLRVNEGYVLQPCWVFKEDNLAIRLSVQLKPDGQLHQMAFTDQLAVLIHPAFACCATHSPAG